jgi:hypothetical protein
MIVEQTTLSDTARRARGRAWVAAALFCCLSWSTAAPAAAQACGFPDNRPGNTRGCDIPGGADRHGHLTVLGINAALGGLTAGIRQELRGGSFWRGFAAGAAGGGAIYAGKWVSAEPFWGAGLAGRQVAAVGASVVRNASEGRAPLEQLMLPVGPVRFYVDRGSGWSTRAKLDLLGAGVLAYQAFSADSRFDGAATVSAGTPVFVTEVARRPGWHGNNTAGVILLREDDSGVLIDLAGREGVVERVFAHERIHLLQYDQAVHTLGAPFEAWLLRRVPGGGWISRNLDVGLIIVPLLLLHEVIPYHDRPWEREADFFSGSR